MVPPPPPGALGGRCPRPTRAARHTCAASREEPPPEAEKEADPRILPGLPWKSLDDQLWYLAACVGVALAHPPAAAAFSLPERGENPFLEGAAGFLFTVAAVWFFFRLLRKRTKDATSRVLRTERKAPTVEEENERYDQLMEAGAISPFLGSFVIGAIAFGLFLFAQGVDQAFAQKTVTGTYAVRNLTITVRTMAQGMCYLACFVFGANALGLFLLSIQMVVAPGLTAKQMKPSQNKVARDEELERLIREVKAGAKASVGGEKLAELSGSGEGYQSMPARNATTKKAAPPPPPEPDTPTRIGRLSDENLMDTER